MRQSTAFASWTPHRQLTESVLKRMSNDMPRRIGLRRVVAYPAVTVALVVSVALVLTPFGPSKVMALTPEMVPAATTTASPTPSSTSAPVSPSPTSATSSTTSATPSPTANPSPSSGGAVTLGGTSVDHYVLARIEASTFQVNYLQNDVAVTDASRFQTFRVRAQLRNAGADSVTVTPQLEYRTAAGGGYTVVPEMPLKGIPFHVVREWVASLGLGGGTIQGPLGDDIAVGDFQIGNGGGLAVKGRHSMGANPDQRATLLSASYTEEEFTVKLSIDAQYLTGYQLRITDGGTPLAGAQVAEIRLGAPPAVVLSPGQHQGAAVVEPLAPIEPAPAAAATVPNATRYALVATPLSAVVADDQIHGLYSMKTDKCGICHRTHTAKAPNLLPNLVPNGSQTNLGSQSTLCLACHDGNGAKPNVGVQYGLTRPANDPVKREYYSHDAVGAIPSTPQHTQSQLNEFGSVDGAVAPLNRHSECADCHNAHQATASTTRDTTPNTDGLGWDASGRLTGVSGVSVENSTAPGASPTSYTFLDGVAKPITREYQLCFKCHSGFTTLTSNVDVIDKPSKYALDKAVEFNPANLSFHPVEAAGKNQTLKMDLSLKGSSSYKLWEFTKTSTIRCLNCHASSDTSGPNPPLTVADPALPQPGSALVPHTSVNRGILLRPYRDRVLKSAAEGYSAKDFALCYTCHGEAPFANAEGPASIEATNFPYHGLHLNGIGNYGPGGTDIDKAGDGKGNAVCAECHFRIHSTTNKVPQTIDGSRLVNFAPNVEPKRLTAAPTWRSTGTGSGTCSITCHGYSHSRNYWP